MKYYKEMFTIVGLLSKNWMNSENFDVSERKEKIILRTDTKEWEVFMNIVMYKEKDVCRIVTGMEWKEVKKKELTYRKAIEEFEEMTEMVEMIKHLPEILKQAGEWLEELLKSKK